jgi:MFS family permease
VTISAHLIVSMSITGSDYRIGVAWGFCLLFYFGQYALRIGARRDGSRADDSTFGFDDAGREFADRTYTTTHTQPSRSSRAHRWTVRPEIRHPVGILLTAIGAIMFGLGSAGGAEFGRLLQGAGSAFAFTGAVYLASHGFTSAWLATAVGFTQCFGMLGGSAGQFAVGPMIHGLISWQQFWIFSGIALVVVRRSC